MHINFMRSVIKQKSCLQSLYKEIMKIPGYRPVCICNYRMESLFQCIHLYGISVTAEQFTIK